MDQNTLKCPILCLTIVAAAGGGVGCYGYDSYGHPVLDPAILAPSGYGSGYSQGHPRYRHDDDDNDDGGGYRYHRRYRNDHDDDDEGGHYRRYRGDDDDD